MTKAPAENTMRIWQEVCTTDPDMTKFVDKHGGFTAICAQSQIKRATELWGPYGSTWGVRELQWQRWGHRPDKPSPPDTPEATTLLLQATFFYPDGAFELASDIPYDPKHECYKKLLTDLTTKALSKGMSGVTKGEPAVGIKRTTLGAAASDNREQQFGVLHGSLSDRIQGATRLKPVDLMLIECMINGEALRRSIAVR